MDVKRKVEQERVVDVTCDICGASTQQHGHARLAATWGYGSGKDCEYHELDLCEKCYDANPISKLVRKYEYSLALGGDCLVPLDEAREVSV